VTSGVGFKLFKELQNKEQKKGLRLESVVKGLGLALEKVGELGHESTIKGLGLEPEKVGLYPSLVKYF
jgi:hypothetical protein